MYQQSASWCLHFSQDENQQGGYKVAILEELLCLLLF